MHVAVVGVEDYVLLATPQFAQDGFFETGLHNNLQQYGNMAVDFSSYASRKTPDAAPFTRGINSFQMVSDGARWWLVSIAWDEERDGHHADWDGRLTNNRPLARMRSRSRAERPPGRRAFCFVC
jgi:hypothetical protein